MEQHSNPALYDEAEAELTCKSKAKAFERPTIKPLQKVILRAEDNGFNRAEITMEACMQKAYGSFR